MFFKTIIVNIALITATVLTEGSEGEKRRRGLTHRKVSFIEDASQRACSSFLKYSEPGCSGAILEKDIVTVGTSVQNGCSPGDGGSLAMYCDASGFFEVHFSSSDCTGEVLDTTSWPNGCSVEGGDEYWLDTCDLSGPCASDTGKSAT
mmetsp:Transcript_27679/g.33668  ORF Transcript_27679/g.33668 Transcript_27679/m.33668 type:complete len:148 (+) Transcript_27679:77-520(+)|eukprot:CAMPEP_0172509978 /NCGR_PEP_ID=MMETSP1066-20121228/225168_1 /TAXON_ID=671091 /ORGANISM="Coscinodiscus wailesii, Strain CCMP2513" /LENGTH=147 /DNA_ID=CAMNT_0013288753 /DNA_START=62 /DNA_END=505 /DNA_ORIENTATION=-